MRFLLDEQLPPKLAELLVEQGHEAEHINRIGLGGSSDADVWQYCINVKAVLLTKDADFLHFARSDETETSVVWIRIGNVTTTVIWDIFKIALPEILGAIDGGERIIEIR